MVMKKLFLISFLLISLYSLGQPGYTDINSGYRWLRGNFRALHVPSGTSFGLQTGQWPGAGALYLDTAGADSGFYYRGVNASWHRLPKATETFYYGDGTFSSNRTVTGGGFSLTFSGLSTFTLGSTGAQSFNANGGVGVRSDIYLRPDSILIEPHDGKITIDSLRSEHGSDTTTYKPLVWSPTNKSVRQLTYWPGGGGGGITGFSDGNGFDGTVTGSNLSLTTTVTDDQVMFSNSGAIAGSANLTWDGTIMKVTGTAEIFHIRNTNAASYVAMGLQATGGTTEILWGYNQSVARGFFQTAVGNNFDILTAGGANTNIRAQSDGETLIGSPADNGAFIFQVNGGSYFSAQTQHELQLKIKDIAAPSTPASGYGVIYVNTDAPRFKDDGGNVTKLNEQQTRTLTIESPSSSENISFFYTDKAITITKAAYAVRGSSPSVTIDVHHHTDRSSGSPNELFGTNVAVTSTTGTTNTTFNDATIPAGSFVWIISSAASGTNNELTITLTFTED
jgi:hypothetical protein